MRMWKSSKLLPRGRGDENVRGSAWMSKRLQGKYWVGMWTKKLRGRNAAQRAKLRQIMGEIGVLEGSSRAGSQQPVEERPQVSMVTTGTVAGECVA